MDKIRFCAEMQKAVSCIARAKLLRPCCLYTLLELVNGNSFLLFLLLFFCLSLGRRKSIL